MPVRSNTAMVEKVLDWVRDHPLPGERMIPICIWGGAGLGKCVTGDTPVIVNGCDTTMDECWERYADMETSEKDHLGEWVRPKQNLLVPSLQDDGQMENRPVTRLYRQQVHEWGRQVLLDDGSEITMTQAHRLRGLHGWQRELKAGDRVAVPARIPWQGKPVDPDLVTFLAWQVSEGSESSSSNSLIITQNDKTVLEQVRAAALRWGKKTGVELNTASIKRHSNGKAWVLIITSQAYKTWLGQNEYVWGYKSKDKRIPDWIVSADDQTIRLFLREFFAAESHVNKKEIEMTMASEVLMHQIQLMLRRFGIWMRVKSKVGTASNGHQIMRTYYRGLISGPSLRIFNSEIGIADDRKQAKLRLLADKPMNPNQQLIPCEGVYERLRELSGLPRSIFGFSKSAVHDSPDLSVARLTSLMEVCLAITGQNLYIDKSNPKNSWARVAEKRLAELYSDESCFASFIETTHLLDDRLQMEVNWTKVKEVKPVLLDGWVYDFEVADTHNYVASMICTHNTQLIRSYCAKRDLSFRGFHPAHSTSGADLAGRQYIDKSLERTVYARPLWLPSEKDPISWNKQGVLFIDEINRAPLQVLQGLMEPIGEGTIDQTGWKLPRDWGFICAANPPRKGYKADDLDEALMDRMLHIPLGFDAIRWTVWANSTNIPMDLVDFTARFPEMMAETDLTLPEEITVKTTPRSMEYLARLYEPGMDMELLRVIANGLIGENPAEAFIDHIRNSDRPVSSQEVVTGRFKEKFSAHLAGHREDLIRASQVLLLATLAGNKFREGTDEPVATHVASYIEMLGSERYQTFWPELIRQAPHWEAPLTRALNG